MHSSYDQLSPQSSRWDQEVGGHVRSNIDWCVRFGRRLVALNPALGFEEAMNLAQKLGLDEDLRAKTPELVAEELSDVDLSTDD